MMTLGGALSALLILLLFTSFVKTLTTLSILRYGMGLHGAGIGVGVLALSIALALFVADPELEHAGGLEGILKSDLAANNDELLKSFRPFIEKHTDTAVRLKIEKFRVSVEPKQAAVKLAENKVEIIQLAAFMITQLKEAFELGLMLLIPFLVIDLLTVNALMSLGITQLSVHVVSLPIKILLFVVVDGWSLLSTKLLGGYF